MRNFIFYFSLLISCSAGAQELSHIQFTAGKTFASFSFTTDQQVIIKISEDGSVLEWGTEMESYRYNYQPGKLLPYPGRVDYYGAEADSASRGKIKMIGTTMFSYYPATEIKEKAGKLRSIGSRQIDYYSNYDNQAIRGKMKSAGNVNFSYYYSHENEAFRGKLKSVNTTTLTWHSTFDDKLLQGKIKSIDNVNYSWYNSQESRYGGGLKSGYVTRRINGVNYIIM